MKISTIILAAGKGTRLKSKHPKVLHEIAGEPLAWHLIQAVKDFSDQVPTLVIGYQANEVKDRVGKQAQYVLQAEQLGTAHAVQQAEELLRGQSEMVLVLLGDMPLIKGKTLKSLTERQKNNSGPVSMITVISDDPRGFGRIVRDQQGQVVAIVEEADCSPEQLKIKELNVSIYCFKADWLWKNLKNIPVSNKGEYYLTDIIKVASDQGLKIQADVIKDSQEAMGINSRLHLAEAEKIMQQQINQAWMEAGVSIIDPNTTYIEANVKIGQDTIIYPNTYLQGNTMIGEDCQIGPNTIIRGSEIGNQCKILSSVVEFAKLESHVDIGPFAHLRKGAHLAEGVHMGNFGEVKNSYLGAGTKMGHFSYIGDTTTGKNVNIGAGTVTCNYDGKNKNKTEIGDDVFIGSDTMLIAPLKIGNRASTGAGSVVNKNIEEDEIVVGMPARAIRKKSDKNE